MKKSKKASSYFLNDLVSAFTMHKFITSISTPFKKMKIYKNVIIDAEGNILKEKEITPYDRMIVGIKRLLLQIPNPNTKAKLKNMTTSIQFFAESSASVGGDPEYIFNEIMKYLEEEMLAGGSGIAGMGTDAENIPVSTRAQKKYTSSTRKKNIRNILGRMNVSDESY